MWGCCWDPLWGGEHCSSWKGELSVPDDCSCARQVLSQGQGLYGCSCSRSIGLQSYYIIIKSHYKRRIFYLQISNEIQGKKGSMAEKEVQ